MSNPGYKTRDQIVTFTGIRYSVLSPRTEDVRVEDIAHHLSNICRFTGACRQLYSVAEHCWRVSYESEGHEIEGLFHDSPEAYITDISAPLKHSPIMAGYRELERLHHDVICDALGIPHGVHPVVKRADERMYHTEVRDLMPQNHEFGMWYPESAAPYDFKIKPYSPAAAEELFLRRYRELTGK